MKVINFEWQQFDLFASTILKDISSLNGEKLLIIGIADGGLPIADRLSNLFKKRTQFTILSSSIRCRRPTTKSKKSNNFKGKIIRSLFAVTPRPLLDLMRTLEHYKLSKRSNSDLQREVLLSSDLERYLNSADIILIIDDAVDSGSSLKLVTEKIKSLTVSSVPIRTLAITITQENPLIQPDYVWLRGCLVRFPWSLDAK